MSPAAPLPLDRFRFRLAGDEDLAACAGVWRIALDDYLGRLGVPPIPDEPGPITRLHAHLRTTDPERFVVAVDPDDAAGEAGGTAGAGRVVGFAAATERDDRWYLSMLFVLPDLQAQGLGSALLDRVSPAPDAGSLRATATDAAQPVANALYAARGIVPRTPLLDLVGLPDRPDAFDPLPSGIVPVAFDELAGQPGGDGHRTLVAEIEALDREILGFTHPADHRFLRLESRRGWLYRGPDDRPLGYGYAGESGRLGPVAVRDPALLGSVLGHLTGAVTPRGAFATWVPGLADRAVVPLLRAGFRMEGFPVLLCWDRPPADFERYLPISPGLL